MRELHTAGTSAASYNSLNQLTNLGGVAYGWDAAGNLAGYGPRSFAWDAENRLAGIGYNVTGHQTAFAYDGRGRRAVIAETTAGGTTTTTYQVWCGRRLCQSLDANGAVVRQYYPEGELIAASNTAFYYGPDQLGTPRDVYATRLFVPGRAGL